MEEVKEEPTITVVVALTCDLSFVTISGGKESSFQLPLVRLKHSLRIPSPDYLLYESYEYCILIATRKTSYERISDESAVISDQPPSVVQ